MKYLRPMLLKPIYYEEIEKKINELFVRMIYAPLLAVIPKKNLMLNTSNALYEALRSGAVYYEDGILKGKFNAAITKELNKLGAIYRPYYKNWSLSNPPPEIAIAIADANVRATEILESMVTVLDGIDVNKIVSQSDIPELYYKTVGKMNEDFQKTVRSITIVPELTDVMKANIAKAWGDNLELYITKWADTNILKLRQEITSNSLVGHRAENMVKSIQSNYNTSKAKAKFLARQETSLLMSKMREERYKDAGVTKYKWSTSHDERVRPLHKKVNGKVFTWNTPPIVGENGERLNPGEDFNCRCIAIPILE